MQTWKTSDHYLNSFRKSMLTCFLMSAVPSWGVLIYLFTVFTKHELWEFLFDQSPLGIFSGVAVLAIIAATPLLCVWFMKVITKRARMTSVDLIDDRLMKRVGSEEEAVLFSQISELQVVRSQEGKIKSLRLVTQNGEGLKIEGIDRFEDLLDALKRAIPHCAVKQWTLTWLTQRLSWLYFSLVFLVMIAYFQEIIRESTFYLGLIGIIIVFLFIKNRLVPREFFYWPNQTLLSSQLGPGYRWLDFVFGAVFLYLLVLAFSQGIGAFREERFVELIRIFFAPIVLAWIFLLPLLRRARSHRKDRLPLVLMAGIVIGVVLIQYQFGKGARYYNEKRYAEAIPYLEKSYRKNPSRIFLGQRLAYSYFMTGNYQRAADVLESLVQKRGEPSAYEWTLYASICKRTGEWERLLEIAEVVIKKNPQSAEAYHHAGLAASQIFGMRSEESRKYYSYYMALNPNQEETAFVREIFPDIVPTLPSSQP